MSVGKSRPPARTSATGDPPWRHPSASSTSSSSSTPQHPPTTTTPHTVSSAGRTDNQPAPALSQATSDSHASLNNTHTPHRDTHPPLSDTRPIPPERHRHRDRRDSNRRTEDAGRQGATVSTARERGGGDPQEKGDRRQDWRYPQSSQAHTHTARPRPMVSSKSSPSLFDKGDPALALAWATPAGAERSVSRSVSSLTEDPQGEGQSQRPSVLRHTGGSRGAPRIVGSSRDSVKEGGKPKTRRHTSSDKHDQLHKRSSGMNIPREAQCAVSHPVPDYQPNYQPAPSSQPGYKPLRGYHPENQNYQLQNSVVPASRPNSHGVPNCSPDSHSVTNYHHPDLRAAPSSLQTGYDHRGREARCVALHSVPGSGTYENVTLHASASLNKGVGEGRDAPHPVSRPCSGGGGDGPGVPAPSLADPSCVQHNQVPRGQEKCPAWPPSAAGTGREPAVAVHSRAPACTDPSSAAKPLTSAQSAPRSPMESNPGTQRNPPENMKARLDFHPSSLSGYLPPRVDPGADKGYSPSCASARDVEGVGRQLLSQRLSTGPTSTPQAVQSLPQRSVPGSLPLPLPPSQGRTGRQDKSTSPLASPRGSLPASADLPAPASRSPLPGDRLHTDPAAPSPGPAGSGGGKRPGKAVIVRSTPYYNTSTQTEPSAYALQTSNPRGVPRCSVQIRVDEADRQSVPGRSAEKGIQARMSREFLPSELEPAPSGRVGKRSPDHVTNQDTAAPAGKSQSEDKSFFQFPFQSMKSIQHKYGVEEEEEVGAAKARQDSALFALVETGDQASIMRQLSAEFYRGSMMGDKAHLGDKPHLGDKAHRGDKPHRGDKAHRGDKPHRGDKAHRGDKPHRGDKAHRGDTPHLGDKPHQGDKPHRGDKPHLGSSSSVSSLWSSSQTSVGDPHHDLSAGSHSSLRLSGPGDHSQRDYFLRSSPRPLQESKQFKSLSAISHQREASLPVMDRALAQSHESLSPVPSTTTTTRPLSQSGRDSGSMFHPPSPSPRNGDSESGSARRGNAGAAAASAGPRVPGPASRHSRTQSVDSGLSERPAGGPRGRASLDNPSSDAGKKTIADVGRKPSMKMAYGIYDDSDIANLTKDAQAGHDPADRGRGVTTAADALHLGQIREEGDSAPTAAFKAQRPGELTRQKTHGDISDTAQSLDSWRDDLDKRTGRFQNRTSSELILSPGDRSAKVPGEPLSSHRPPRLFDGSIDSGVGSEISCRVDGVVTPSDTPRSLLFLDNPTGAELKQIQQQAVLSFLQRKTRLPFHSPEPSLCESSSTTIPRGSQSKAADPVADLISRTNATLAKRTDSLRRTSSVCSRSSSGDQVEVNRERKETEWSRLRSSGSFNYGSNRSSLCSDSPNEDITVFAPSTPRGSLHEVPAVGQDTSDLATDDASQDNQR
ncbi:hypothetical protein ACOMHN_050409 [Nucella lapillus]